MSPQAPAMAAPATASAIMVKSICFLLFGSSPALVIPYASPSINRYTVDKTAGCERITESLPLAGFPAGMLLTASVRAGPFAGARIAG